MGTNIARSPLKGTDSLLLHLDPGNIKSYSGTGTSISSIHRGQGVTLTLQNGPTYNSSFGAFSYDGVDSLLRSSNRITLFEFLPSTPFSIFSWINVGTVPTNLFGFPSNIISCDWSNTTSSMAGTVTTLGGWAFHVKRFTETNINEIGFTFRGPFQITTEGSGITVAVEGTNILNGWVQVGMTYDGSTPTNSSTTLSSVDFYLNGNLHTTNKAIEWSQDGFTEAYSWNENVDVPARLSIGRANTGSDIFGRPQTGLIGPLQVFNRKLTADEIKQNYAVNKTRFGHS